MALGLRAVARSAESLTAGQSLDLVWTDPTSRHVPVRLSRAVLLWVIGGPAPAVAGQLRRLPGPGGARAQAAAAVRGAETG